MFSIRSLTSVALLAAACTGSVASVQVSAPRLSAAAPRLLTHIGTQHKLIALTFDACETKKPAGYDSRIIKILRQTHTPATLMLGGRWMETHPAATRDLGADPLFELGNHSYLHPHMIPLTAAAQQAEMRQTQDVMYRLTGKQGHLFRPPYGEYNSALVHNAAACGLTTMTWSIVTGDPDKHISARSIVQTVTSHAKPGAIVIMHVNGRGWHTAEALPQVIRNLRAKAYRFATVSQMLADQAATR